MSTTSQDIIETDDVAQTIEDRTAEMHQFRRAYRDHDASDISSNSFTFPEWGDDLDEDDYVEIAELSEYPHADVSLDGVQVTYTKYGFQVPISDEAVSDNAVSLALDQMGELARAEERKLDRLAYGYLAENMSDTTVSSDTPFNTLVDAQTEMVDAGYDPGQLEMYLSPQAWGKLAKDDVLNRATDQGDALARNGQLATAFGMDLVLSNIGVLGANEAILVDTSKFGYESTRWPMEVSVNRDEDRDADVYKIRRRLGWAAMDPDAAISVDFSTA